MILFILLDSLKEIVNFLSFVFFVLFLCLLLVLTNNLAFVTEEALVFKCFNDLFNKTLVVLIVYYYYTKNRLFN